MISERYHLLQPILSLFHVKFPNICNSVMRMSFFPQQAIQFIPVILIFRGTLFWSISIFKVPTAISGAVVIFIVSLDLFSVIQFQGFSCSQASRLAHSLQLSGVEAIIISYLRSQHNQPLLGLSFPSSSVFRGSTAIGSG